MTTVWTTGHSTRSAEEFLTLLKAHRIECLADVRTIPKSRRNPQFHIDVLPATLRAAGIEYRHLPGLGGLRRPRKDSTNTAWKNDSFRGYADYMNSAEFNRNIDELIAHAERAATVIMCAEAVPWRCHRSLIADALTARGVRVLHIMDAGDARPHTVTSFARIDGAEVTYPGLPVPLAE